MERREKVRIMAVVICFLANLGFGTTWVGEAMADPGYGLCDGQDPEEECHCTTWEPNKNGFCSVTGSFEECVREGTGDPCYAPE